MSLNWKEIDAVLGEMQLPDSHIQKIRQPDYQSLIFECYRPGNRFSLYISLQQGKTRLHLLTRQVKNEIKLQRFAQFLRSRVKGGRITECYQAGRDRIVKLEILRGGEITCLWIRLWGGASNIIATDISGTILDAFYRRPKRGETSGGFYAPESTPPAPKKEVKEYRIRDFSGMGTFNERVETLYFTEETGRKYDVLKKQITDELDRRENGIQMTLSRLNNRLSEYGQLEQFRQYGDIITSRLHTMKKGDTRLAAENMFEDGTQVSIELKPELSPAENAEHYYRKYRKAKSGMDVLRREIAELEKSRKSIIHTKADAETAENLEALEKLNIRIQGKKGSGVAPAFKEKEKKPGLSFASGGFRILVGRSARENDELLRNHVRGNDIWLHTRDYPGAYVFIKTIQGKSVPLDILLDAGNLALFYSKGKASGKGDLYYTHVKHLKRPREGKMGLVLPTQEKNLSVVLDMKRIRNLQGPDTSI